MAMQKIFSFGPPEGIPAKTNSKLLVLPPTVKKDVFLGAMLEIPEEKQPHRSPLEWAGAGVMHALVLAVLIIVPLYTTGTISLGDFQDVPLVAPPPPPPPPSPTAAAAPAVSHVTHPKAQLTFNLHKITTPNAIPKDIPHQEVADAAPSLGGVAGGLPGGVAGGQIGGALGGAFGSTGTATPPPPPPSTPPPAKRIVRVGSDLKAPRQIVNVNPIYPPLAQQARVSGTVLIDAVIDEQGDVVRAHAISGPPLLIPAALKAVLQWKYAPTVLNGEPVSVELVVQVHFNPQG